MEILKAEKLAIQKMNEHGLMAMGYKFGWNNRKAAAGVCRHKAKRIELSLPLTTLSSEEDVLDTIILHEIAHALTPGDAHGPKWQKKAIEIGANGKRCYSAIDKKSTGRCLQLVS